MWAFYIAVTRKCGISKKDILSKPKLSQVIPDFMNWINCLIREVSLATRTQHFPGMDFQDNITVYQYINNLTTLFS